MIETHRALYFVVSDFVFKLMKYVLLVNERKTYKSIIRHRKIVRGIILLLIPCFYKVNKTKEQFEVDFPEFIRLTKIFIQSKFLV